MSVSVTELREQSRLLEGELARLATLSDSLDTRAGVTIGFAGAISGLLVQVKHPNGLLHAAVVVALASAIVGVTAAFPRRTSSPDPEVMASYYDRLSEDIATGFVCRAGLKAIGINCDIADLKRALLAVSVLVLVVAIMLAVLAVR